MQSHAAISPRACPRTHLEMCRQFGLTFLGRKIPKSLGDDWAEASRNHFDWGGVFIESPEYAIFIKLPEFYWMR